MLHYEVLHPEALGLLMALAGDPLLADYRLAGGTALALQVGHRMSLDLDFFNSEGRRASDWSDRLAQHGETRVIHTSTNICVYSIAGIKVDVVSVKHPWLEPELVEDGIRLASKLDIAAMKLAAVTNRGTRKDFVDLSFLLDEFGLDEMLVAYSRRCPEGTLFLVAKSLAFFDDAEEEPMPVMLLDRSWETVRESVIRAIRTSKLFRR